MIAILGATGTTGNALLRTLTAQGVPCRALTRTPHKLAGTVAVAAPVEVVPADAADPRSLRTALKGCDQLFLSMANQPNQVELEIAAIDAAAAAGVEHVVKLSAPAAEPDSPVAVSRGHAAIEAHLLAAVPHVTILRPYAFMQKLLLLAPGVTAGNVIVGAMGQAPCNYIDARDIADVAAVALTRRQAAGTVYELTGGRAVSHPELAALLSSLTGRRIAYVDLDPAEFHAHLVRTAGMPDWLAWHIVEIQQLAVNRPESPNSAIEDLLGRAPRSLEDFLAQNRAAFA
ncbi:NmrA family NAD(P)-binding protein [Catenulispora subtropica]|uniref:NAD(P)H-binding protein n=1 Tax=Catenulispora subtropica TaxID=450798 RepID=A0ABN2S8E6_9ACTN